MPLSFKYGVLLYKPIRDVLQRWRRSLASLLFFTILLTDNFGLSNTAVEFSVTCPNAPPTPRTANNYNKTYRNYNNNDYRRGDNGQCLFLNRYLSDEMCSRSERYDQRTKLARTTTLRFCGHYPVYSVIPNDTMSQCFKGSYQQCKQCFQDLEDRDNYVNKIYCQFLNIMDRTDCETSYSAIHTSNCHTCKQAYKDWLCAYHIPYYRAGQLIVPCMDYCTEIENRCPYLLPAMDDQYSGEPTFLCTGADSSYRHNLDNTQLNDHHAHAAAKQTTPCHRLISPKKDRVCLHINNHTSSRGHQVASCLTTLVISLWLYRTVKSCTSIGLT